MSTDVLSEYYSALERLKSGKAKIVPKGTKISKNSVSIEAGRGKGAIKKSRPIFRDLIENIRLASDEQTAKDDLLKNRLEREKGEAKKYRRLYEESLGRELSLLYEIEQLKTKIQKLEKTKVVRIR